MSTIRLDASGPFHHDAALAMLAAHAVPGAENTDREASTHTRVLPSTGGPTVVTITFDAGGVCVDLDADDATAAEVSRRIRSWLDLDTDTALVDRTLIKDALLETLVARRPGIRLVGFPDEFEAVAATVIGQQVSLAAARTFAGRLVARYGTPIDEFRTFPSAAVLADRDPDELQECAGLTRARAKTLHTVATEWADGDRLAGLAADEARRMLLAIPGVGPWTADYLLVRALQHPDTFAPGDLVARRALGLDQQEAGRRASVWAPYRSYALLHLWTEAAYL
ncbi:DNA-3-methyladenine glycosylase family protein [Dactylosporangium sp. NPDC048998]|uniref:DNA-3-methyladenine glycosylase family protein n=1 Tax=Dactylosporangium sp. NPDC048998 TaxID=3363976 RepID=UPI00371A9773